MQGHPEAPCLWEKHADWILRTIGLAPTTHEPCLYSGVIGGQRVLLLQQVDDFAVATSTALASRVFDLIDDHLTIPLKRLCLITLFNGLDTIQSRDYIKLSCRSYIERICEKYLDGWGLSKHHMATRPTPLPQTDSFIKSFLSATGDATESAQAKLSTSMGIKYPNVLGELIFTLITCRPDLSYAVVKCAQATTPNMKSTTMVSNTS